MMPPTVIEPPSIPNKAVKDEDGQSFLHHADNGIGIVGDAENHIILRKRDDEDDNDNRNYFAQRTDKDYDNNDDDDDDEEVDEFADFITSKWQDGVETGLTVTWPRPMVKQNKVMLLSSPIVPSSPSTPSLPSQPTHCLHLSTQLQEDAIAPLFDGTQWAGTRVWKAAILGLEYILNVYGSRVDDNTRDDYCITVKNKSMSSLLELGCGLGVPGMLWYMTQQRKWSERQQQQQKDQHQLQQPYDGAKSLLSSSQSPSRPSPRVTLTDQKSLLPQLESNLVTNFGRDYKIKHNIHAKTLSWSEQGILDLLKEEEETDEEDNDCDIDNGQHRRRRYDICLNCDCIYEPLYGVEARRALTEVLRTIAIHSPKTILVTSVERRNGDGVGTLLHDLAQSGVVETDHANRIPCMYRNDDDPHHVIEIYVTKGIDKV